MRDVNPMTLALEPHQHTRRRIVLSIPLMAAGLWSLKARAEASMDLAPLYASVVADASRSDADKKQDASRQPVAFLQFTGVKPGMHVLDIAAGGGYTTDLLSRVVGPTGRVFAQTEKTSPALQARIASLGNVTLVESGGQDPVPMGARPLDLITIILAYHDLTYETVDRAAMNRTLFDALGENGRLVIIDHAAKAGNGANDAKTLHRVDELLVKKEMTDAGFVLDQESKFLRNSDDPRDQPFFKMTTPTDRFALRYKKP